MDFFINKEIKALKGEIQGKAYALEADKASFGEKLKGELGKEIKKELHSPSSPKKINGLKLKIARWKSIRKSKKEENKIIKRIKTGNYIPLVDE